MAKSNREYWKERELATKQKQLDRSADYEQAMQYRLKDMQEELIKEADKYLGKYAETNNISKEAAANILLNVDTSKYSMTLAEFERKAKAGGYEKELSSAYYKSRIGRLNKLYSQFQTLAGKYAYKESNRLAASLAGVYLDVYNGQQYNQYRVKARASKGIVSPVVNLHHFNEQELKSIVSKPWAGSNFSSRIWGNYTKELPEVLTDRLLRGTLTGASPYRVEQSMRDAFAGVEQKNLHRLVVTEMNHASEQATLQFYKDSNIEYYQYEATLESHTCDVCEALDGKVFKVKDEVEGENYPLMHPYCRCTTVPYDKTLPDIGSRWSRDEATGKGELIKPLNYSDWKKANNIKPFILSAFLAAQKPSPSNPPSSTPQYTALNDDVEKTLGPEYSERIKTVFAKAPVRVQKLYNKFSKQIKLMSFNKRLSFYHPAYNAISFRPASFNEEWRDNMATYFHEVGHFIDQNSKIGGPYASATEARQVGTNLMDDWTNDKIEPKMQEIAKNGIPEEDIKPWTNGQKLYYPAYRVLKYNKNGTLSKTSLRMVAKYEVQRDNINLARELLKDSQKAGLHGYSGLSDAISGATDNAYNLGAGHKKSYYQGYEGRIKAGKEFFANYLAAYVEQTGEVERMRKYFPKTSAACEKIIDDTLAN